MALTIVKIISSAFKLRKPTVFFLCFFIFLGIVVPFHQAFAFVDLLAGLIIEYAVAFVVQLAVTVCNLLLQLFAAILLWTTGPAFGNLSYTGLTYATGEQTIVGVGWELTRDLTNIIFILAMVVIGLGTVLRIGDYQAKKALPRLLVIGLLINFTPVLCGFIVDATNIVMNFFLSELSGIKLLASTFGAQGAILLNVLKGFFNPLVVAQSILQGLMLIIFDVGAALVFLLFSLLFLLRYVAIWMLVILSPFAFGSYILTDRFWKQWWDQFIQWSVIGAIGGFFLYLGNHILAMAGQGMMKIAAPESGFVEKYLLSFVADLAPFMLALAFLFLGFIMTLQTSAMGVGGITKGIKAGGKALGKWAGKTALERSKSWTRERVPAKWRERGAKLAIAKTPTFGWGKDTSGRNVRGVGAYVKRAAAKGVSALSAPVLAGGRTIGVVVGPAMVRSEKAKIAQVEDDIAKRKLAVPEILQTYRSATDDATRIAAVNAIANQQKVDEATDVVKYGTNALTNVEVDNLLQKATSWGAEDTIKSAFLHLPRVQASVVPQTHPTLGRMETTGEAMGREIIRKMRPDDFKKISKVSMKPTTEGDNVMEAILTTVTGDRLSKLLEAHQDDGVEAVQRNIQRLAVRDGMTTRNWIRDRTKLERYLTTGAGTQNYGIRI